MNVKNFFKSILTTLICLNLMGCGTVLLGTAAITSVATVSDPRTTGSVIDDEGVEVGIRYAVNSNDWLRKGSHVSPISVNGILLLMGQVPSQEVKNEIAKIAYEDASVVEVVNELEVGPASSFSERSNDTYITGKVKTAIINQVNINPTVINVSTERAKVYLMGLVSQEEGEKAAQVASQVGGVRKVIKVFEYIE